MSRRMPVQASSMRRLAAVGVDPHAVARRAGLSASFVENPAAGLDTRQFFAVWRAIGELSGDELLGLRLGSAAAAGALEPSTMVALYSSTFGEALPRLARYKRLSCPEEVHLHRDGAIARLSFHWTLAQEPAPHLVTDVAFASIHAIALKGAGRAIAPRRLELARTLRSVEPYARHFDCEVLTGCGIDALVYDGDALDVPFVSNNHGLLTALAPVFDQRLEQLAEPAIEARAHAALTKLMQGSHVSVESLALELDMSTRSLQRRLGEAGTTYQAVLDRVRLEMARRLLSETAFSPGEIAFFLGFEEANSFHRAFRRWEGRTPSQWRQQRALPHRATDRPAFDRAGDRTG